jgi:hypothetical protein
MAVELAATLLASGQGSFSPQHVNNWTIEIEGLPAGQLRPGDATVALMISRGFLPTVGVDEVGIPFGNETVYVAGRARYEGGTLEVRDYVDIDTQDLLTQWFDQVYGGVRDGASGRVGQPSRYKKPGNLLIAAPDGTENRRWAMRGIWPMQMNFGSLDQGSSEQVQIACSLRYDKAVYKGKSSSFETI